MTTLVLNGEGIDFTAPFTTSYNYTQQSWGGNWSGAYFAVQWYGQGLSYATGSLLPSGGVLTQVTVTSPTTGQTIFSVTGANYSINSTDVGIDSQSMAIQMVINSTTPVTIFGSTSNDKLHWLGGTSHSPASIDGGAGNDTLYLSQSFSNYSFSKFNAATNSLTIHSAAVNEDAVITGVEYFSFKDMTIGYSSLLPSTSTSTSTSTNTITGTTGNDTLQGTIANDSINGGDGNDTLVGGAGNDSIYGGKGTDTAQYSGAYSNFTVTALYAGKNGAFSGYQVGVS